MTTVREPESLVRHDGLQDTVPRVLVVDDDVAFAKRLGRMLEAEGLVVSVTHDGADALAAVAETVPDLVVLDICMPVMDGVACLRALRARFGTRHPAVVILTGDPSPRVQIAHLLYNTVCVLRKPCAYETILDTARRVLRDEASRREEEFPGRHPGSAS